MKISNEIKSRFIELIVVEAVKEHYPSYRIEVSLETENIKGSFKNYIWISEEAIDTFILELENLDRTRCGQAKLQSMDPGELNLLFKPIDTVGHLAVELLVKKEDRIALDYSYDINISFQVDPTNILSVVKDLKKMKV